MLLAALVLVAINGKHDCLQERVNLGHGDQTAEVRNVSRFGLKQEQQVAVSLCFVVVGERSLLHFGRIFEMTCNFVLLEVKVST